MRPAEDAQLEAALADRRPRDFGLLDPDQPTPRSHAEYVRRMQAEFTPLERRLIRAALLEPSDA